MAKRNPIDFDTKNPPLAVTNPVLAEAIERGEAKPDPNYPKHLVRPDLGGGGQRELVVVVSATEEQRQRAKGYMTHQDADRAEARARGTADVVAPAAKLKPGRKPRNPMPVVAEASV